MKKRFKSKKIMGFLLSLVAVLSVGGIIWASNATNNVSDETINLHFIGDELGMTYNDEESFPIQGWGYFLNEIFDATVQINDYSVDKASLESYLETSSWTNLQEQVGYGDVVVIALGRNDAINNTSAENVETALGVYKETLESKGAQVLYTTPVPTVDDSVNEKLASFSEVVKAYINAQNEICIDLYELVRTQYAREDVGYTPYDLYYISEAAKTHYLQFQSSEVTTLSAKADELLTASDKTIMNERGAKMVADKFAEGLADEELELKSHLIDALDAKVKPVRYNVIPKYSSTTASGSNIKAVLMAGMPYHGTETEVFAYVGVPAGATAENPVPAMVLVHGGSGSAYKNWVDLWCSKGYAAIAMFMQDPNYEAADSTNAIDYYGGPKRTDETLSGTDSDSFMYHATSTLSLAYNLLNSLDEVKTDEIGVTGISWGGIITSSAIGRDTRFKFAMPVYGGGYLNESKGAINYVDFSYDGQYTFDNSVEAQMPVFWINGTNDRFFSLNITSRSAYATLSQICIKKNSGTHSQEHGSGSTGDIPELFAYADEMLKGGTPLPKLGKIQMNGREAIFSCEAQTEIKSVKLWYNTTGLVYSDSGAQTTWQSFELSDYSGETISYTIPKEAIGIYFEVTDANGLAVTTDYLEVVDKAYFDESGTYKISDYWSEGTKKVPVKENYIFGGWYKKDGDNFVALNESELSDDIVKNMGATDAYPKFVPAEVLSVKTQLGTSDTETSLRLVSTIDSEKYQKVGFEYQLGSRAVQDYEMSRVYSAIKKSKTSDETLYPKTTFVEASKYFIALDVNNISSKSFASIVYARPYWITMDGTKVMGLARNNRVEDKTNNYISIPINVLSDGKAPAGMAAGKIQITYNAENYDVVSVDGRLLPEMKHWVDESLQTITFVGNAETVNSDIEANGLLFNIRFIKSEDATSDDLDFSINTSGFCNWAEQMLDADALVVQ